MNGRMWTLKELEIVSDQTLSHTSVSKKIDRCVESIFTKRKELGIIVKCKGHRQKLVAFTDEEDQLILDNKGHLTDLAKRLGKKYHNVWARKELLNGRV